MERHFSTSDAVDAGEGGIRLACVCFTDSLDGFVSDFILCKAFKRVKERAQNREIIGREREAGSWQKKQKWP